MNNRVSDTLPGDGLNNNAQHYKRDFWSKENLKFGRPWYRLEKSARIISRLAGGKECSLLDIGCGPAALMRLLPPNIRYYGIDIAIQDPAPNLLEADLLESPIKFGDKHFDIIIAQGVFEYMSGLQSQKFAEVAQLLNKNGAFIVSYTNFGHRKKNIYEAFSNVQPIGEFRQDLAYHFNIDRSFPGSHNWAHSQPNRNLIKVLNMYSNINVPFVSPILAVEYFFICSPRNLNT